MGKRQAIRTLAVGFIVGHWFWVGCQGNLFSAQPSPRVFKSDRPTSAIADTQWTPPVPLPATQSYRILFALKDTYDPATNEHGDLYQAEVWQGAVNAAQDLGVEVELLPNDCHTCVEAQIRAIATRIEQRDLDGMVVMVTDSVRLATIIERAIAQGIPVIAIDTPVNTDQILTFVAFDNFAGGQLMGEWVAHQLNGQGNVLMLDGALQQQNAIDRKQGFLAGLRMGEINVLDTQSGNWSEATAMEITKKWLQRFDQIDAIIAANYAMAQGAADALQAYEHDDEIWVTGFDAMPNALDAIERGDLMATINQIPAQQARLALELLVRHLETSETFPSRIFLPEIHLIDQGNIGEMSMHVRDSPVTRP
ncbi:MAG: sugar ABC transporter substrate-binding protein [Spirulina sp. SIO3F2]|nr:sugar ABC transporter substrate-binding protein [Spirulina sp. SIO3F2]